MDMTATEPDAHDDALTVRRAHLVVAGAVSGVAAALMGLGAAELAAGTTTRLRSPVLDVGDRVVDQAPGWLKELAIDWFGTRDKLALLVGIGVVLGLYAAAIGVIGFVRRARDGVIGIALFGVLGAAAALDSRTGVDVWRVVPSMVGATVAATTLAALIAWYVPRSRPDLPPLDASTAVTDDSPTDAPASPERRWFLAGAGAVAAVGALGISLGRRLEARFSAADSRRALRLPAADVPAPAVSPGARLPTAPPLFTPNAEFYRIDTALSVPQVRAEDWQLDVTGLVGRELRLSYDDLLRRELVESDITLTCVSNTVGGELIGTARWLGIRLDDLLADAGVDPTADQIVGRSVDGYTCGFPTAALDGRDALVAIGMNGEPLPLEHGFPARLIVPGIYGYASATKWLREIELTRFDDFDHYWVPRGYSAEAPIKMQSRIDAPRGLDRIAPGEFVVRGVAWAQPVGVDAVEIRVDDGPWRSTRLGDEVNASTWRQWSFPWTATPGRHTISVRAIDRHGAIQTEERSEPLPNGATGHHTVVVLVDEA